MKLRKRFVEVERERATRAEVAGALVGWLMSHDCGPWVVWRPSDPDRAGWFFNTRN